MLLHLTYSYLQERFEGVRSLCEDKMARFSWKYLFLAVSSLASAQSSTSNAPDGLTTDAGSQTASVATATLNGSPTTYSVAFTVPASADVGPNILPNVLDPNAKQAQDLCPGYSASNVQRTTHGFTASLTLAGEPVRRGNLSLVSKANRIVQCLWDRYRRSYSHRRSASGTPATSQHRANLC